MFPRFIAAVFSHRDLDPLRARSGYRAQSGLISYAHPHRFAWGCCGFRCLRSLLLVTCPYLLLIKALASDRSQPKLVMPNSAVTYCDQAGHAEGGEQIAGAPVVRLDDRLDRLVPAMRLYGHGSRTPTIEKLFANELRAKQLPVPNESSVRSPAANANGDGGGLTPLLVRRLPTTRLFVAA
jgi:hypothetical protein